MVTIVDAPVIVAFIGVPVPNVPPLMVVVNAGKVTLPENVGVPDTSQAVNAVVPLNVGDPDI